MNTTHIINLLRAYFIEHRKMLLILTIIAFAAATLESIDGLLEMSHGAHVIIMIVIAGIFFQPSLKRNNSAHFFNLPVTAGEKLVNAIIVLTTFMILLQIIIVAGSYIGYYLVRPVFHNGANMFVVNGMSILKLSVWDATGYLRCAAVLAVFLFGSIYFKKKAFIKTFAVGAGFVTGISLYNLLLLFIAFGSINPVASGEYSFENTGCIHMLTTSFYGGYEYIIFPVITLFFLSLTYLRLKETEV